MNMSMIKRRELSCFHFTEKLGFVVAGVSVFVNIDSSRQRAVAARRITAGIFVCSKEIRRSTCLTELCDSSSHFSGNLISCIITYIIWNWRWCYRWPDYSATGWSLYPELLFIISFFFVNIHKRQCIFFLCQNMLTETLQILTLSSWENMSRLAARRFISPVSEPPAT